MVSALISSKGQLLHSVVLWLEKENQNYVWVVFKLERLEQKCILTLVLNVEMFDWNSVAGIPKKVGSK